MLNAFRHHRGGHAGPALGPVGHRNVLNAFRHHRGGHLPRGELPLSRRHVLNAFRHHRGGHANPDASASRRLRAQRLSASQRWACRCRPARLSGCPVLNAFRHHRGGHLPRGELPLSRRHVLNAFRHHRGGHGSIYEYTYGSTTPCSTPFGITEVGMRILMLSGSRRLRAQRLSASQRWACRCRPARLSGCPVLNAFRHHRGGHCSQNSCTLDERPCSTPFGITEVGMPCAICGIEAGSWCSTPFGITEVGICLECLLSLFARVLNAFRHHRGGHSPFGGAEPRSVGAQRLSASQRWACS